MIYPVDSVIQPLNNRGQVLRRFFSIRGYPAVLLSDNGTQMVGAAREQREMVQDLDSDQLREYCAERRIHWILPLQLPPTRMDVLRHLLRVASEL